MKQQTIVGIDVGTTKICVLIGEVTSSETVNVVGVGICPSHGLRKGIVVSSDDAAASVETAVRKAERVSGYKIVSAYVGIAGGHIASQNSRGVVSVTRSDRTIMREDVERAVEAARVITLPENRQIIHAIPRNFIIDGHDGVRNPLGLRGYRLETDCHIVTGAATSVENLIGCVQRQGIEIDDVVLQPLASSESVLTDEEREMGVVLVDIGGGTTDIAVFQEGLVAHTAVLPVGGNHLSNDLAVGLRTPFAKAEEVKIEHGHAIPDQITDEEILDITTFGHSERNTVARKRVAEIIEARLQEMFAMIYDNIQHAGYDTKLPAGVVLTGGCADLPGILELAHKTLNMPVRIGRPRGIHGLNETVSSPAYATAVGLLLWGAHYGGKSPVVCLNSERVITTSSRRNGRDRRVPVTPAPSSSEPHKPRLPEWLLNWLKGFQP